jgi:hypothetical protein
LDVKNAFQGIATAQKTLLVLFREMMQEFHSRIGIDRAPGSYKGYKQAYKHLECFIQEKYKVSDIPLTRLDLSFIEAFDFYLHVDRKMKSGSVVMCIIFLQKAARIARNRNLISRPPFIGYKPERIELKNRSLTKEELERIVSRSLPTSKLCYIRDLFVFSAFTVSHMPTLKNSHGKKLLRKKTAARGFHPPVRKRAFLFMLNCWIFPCEY